MFDVSYPLLIHCLHHINDEKQIDALTQKEIILVAAIANLNLADDIAMISK